jgi:hypothetical protein
MTLLVGAMLGSLLVGVGTLLFVGLVGVGALLFVGMARWHAYDPRHFWLCLCVAVAAFFLGCITVKFDPLPVTLRWGGVEQIDAGRLTRP